MFRFMLAPMEGYTDAALRTLCFRHGADLIFTEMAHVESLLRRNRASLSKLDAPDSTPVQVQLLTGREGHLERFLSGFEPTPGFRGFNLNLSCPSPEVIWQGKGAAMVKRAAKTRRLASIISGHGYPVSLKLRLGTNAHEKAGRVYLNALGVVEADFYVVHAKTASQGSAEPEDQSVYPACVEAAGGKPVIANGGIDSAEKVEALRVMGLAGVMIGRAALRNPAIFDTIRNQLVLNSPLRQVPGADGLVREYAALREGLGGDNSHEQSLMRVMVGKEEAPQY